MTIDPFLTLTAGLVAASLTLLTVQEGDTLQALYNGGAAKAEAVHTLTVAQHNAGALAVCAAETGAACNLADVTAGTHYLNTPEAIPGSTNQDMTEGWTQAEDGTLYRQVSACAQYVETGYTCYLADDGLHYLTLGALPTT